MGPQPTNIGARLCGLFHINALATLEPVAIGASRTVQDDTTTASIVKTIRHSPNLGWLRRAVGHGTLESFIRYREI